jgi:hypothetical protein
MSDTTTCKLRLYEALELRAEYDARVSTIKDCLENARGKSERASLWREDEGKRRPSPDFDANAEREAVRKLEFKRRKLNSAVQKANYETQIEFEGQQVNLLEALDVRKALNRELAELKGQLVAAASQTVIYKEDRDIVEDSDIPYTECRSALDKARVTFRELNRKLRRASFETVVDYQDE